MGGDRGRIAVWREESRCAANGLGKERRLLRSAALRKRKEGPTLIVSPLLALMRNQIEMAAKLGLRAVSFTSDNAGEWESCVADLQAGKVDVALVAPERLSRPEFAETALPYFFERGGSWSSTKLIA